MHGVPKLQFGTEGFLKGQFETVCGVAVDGSDRILLTDYTVHTVRAQAMPSVVMLSYFALSR